MYFRQEVASKESNPSICSLPNNLLWDKGSSFQIYWMKCLPSEQIVASNCEKHWVHVMTSRGTFMLETNPSRPRVCCRQHLLFSCFSQPEATCNMSKFHHHCSISSTLRKSASQFHTIFSFFHSCVTCDKKGKGSINILIFSKKEQYVKIDYCGNNSGQTK